MFSLLLSLFHPSRPVPHQRLLPPHISRHKEAQKVRKSIHRNKLSHPVLRTRDIGEKLKRMLSFDRSSGNWNKLLHFFYFMFFFLVSSSTSSIYASYPFYVSSSFYVSTCLSVSLFLSLSFCLSVFLSLPILFLCY